VWVIDFHTRVTSCFSFFLSDYQSLVLLKGRLRESFQRGILGVILIHASGLKVLFFKR
jgi:hypothetical protein